MSVGINRYRELARTLTIDVACHLTALRTRSTMFRQKASARLNADNNLTQIDISVSETEVYTLPMNGIQKVLLLSAPHRFKIFYRATELDEFAQFSVCDGIYSHVGPIMGQIQIVGDYTEPVRCTVVYS